MSAPRLEELRSKSSFSKWWSDSVAEVSSEIAEEVIEFMTDAAAPDDHAIEKSIEHGVGDFTGFEIPSVKVIKEPLKVSGVSHAFTPDESVPVWFFSLP